MNLLEKQQRCDSNYISLVFQFTKLRKTSDRSISRTLQIKSKENTMTPHQPSCTHQQTLVLFQGEFYNVPK